MINSLKALFFKLSYNQSLIKIAKKVFVYFPSLRAKLIKLKVRDNSYLPTQTKIKIYKSDFLEAIKEEIERKAKQSDKV